MAGFIMKSKKLQLLVEKIINYFLYFLTLAIEWVIMQRFYFSQEDVWSRKKDLAVQLLVIATMTPLIFVCLWRASKYDCGRLPREEVDRETDNSD